MFFGEYCLVFFKMVVLWFDVFDIIINKCGEINICVWIYIGSMKIINLGLSWEKVNFVLMVLV